MKQTNIYQFALNIMQETLDNACQKMDSADYADLLHELHTIVDRRLSLVERGIHQFTI